MSYLLDADVFITAKNLHYGLDFCPAFWEWLVTAHLAGTVFSIEKVADEIRAGADELSTWAGGLPTTFFLQPDQTVVSSFNALTQWATSGHYEPAAVNTFLQVADYYLVAHAHAQRHIVITHERPSPSTRRIKIPDACLALNVPFISPFDMLRREQARFVLGPQP